MQLERQLSGQRADLAHLDATLRLFDPTIRLTEIRPRRRYVRNTWFRHGECLRLIYDALREAGQPVTTRDLCNRIMRIKPNFHTCHATLPENPQNTARFASLGKIVVLNLGIP